MKKIYITLFTLVLAMMAMVYFYFSNLDTQNNNHDLSLNAVAANSGLIFCLRNDKDIVNILSGQDYFQKLVGANTSKQLTALKENILSIGTVSNLMIDRKVYIGFLPAGKRTNDYLLCTELVGKEDHITLINTLKSAKVRVDSISGGFKLTTKDSSIFYLGIKENLLVLSGSNQPMLNALNSTATQASTNFVSYIKSAGKFGKNSLANLYIDYNRFPQLLKAVIPNTLDGELSVFNKQDSYAVLNYNFSKERVFFNGSSVINNHNSYLSLFTSAAPLKNAIDNILPANTANFTLYAIADYTTWHKSLQQWFTANKDHGKVKKTITSANQKYRLNLDQIFPKYFKNQFINFQLKTTEKIGAVQLINGDKVSQLLLDISENYNDDIKLLKEPDLLYCYFGEPFKKFRKPYYIIIDNYMVFSNYASTLQTFLNNYRNNQLLVNEKDYINLYNQIANNATVTFYVNHKNSDNLILNTFYTDYYRYFESEDGFKDFSSLIYQLSGDKGSFQTNFLINTIPKITQDSTLNQLTDEEILPISK